MLSQEDLQQIEDFFAQPSARGILLSKLRLSELTKEEKAQLASDLGVATATPPSVPTTPAPPVVTPTTSPAVKAPTAYAGANIEIGKTENLYKLKGTTDSTNPDAVFKWTKKSMVADTNVQFHAWPNGGQVAEGTIAKGADSPVAINMSKAGAYVFELTVTDPKTGLTSAPSPITVTKK